MHESYGKSSRPLRSSDLEDSRGRRKYKPTSPHDDYYVSHIKGRHGKKYSAIIRPVTLFRCGRKGSIGKNPFNKAGTIKSNPHSRLLSEVGFELGSTEVKGMG